MKSFLLQIVLRNSLDPDSDSRSSGSGLANLVAGSAKLAKLVKLNNLYPYALCLWGHHI